MSKIEMKESNHGWIQRTIKLGDYSLEIRKSKNSLTMATFKVGEMGSFMIPMATLQKFIEALPEHLTAVESTDAILIG